jgi:hypothetical protein
MRRVHVKQKPPLRCMRKVLNREQLRQEVRKQKLRCSKGKFKLGRPRCASGKKRPAGRKRRCVVLNRHNSHQWSSDVDLLAACVHQMKVEAKMRNAAIQAREAEAERAEEEAKKRVAEADALVQDTEAKRKEDAHHGGGESRLFEERKRQALEEVERLQAEARQAQVSAKMHEEVAEQKEAMARLMEVEARKLDARAQDRETEARLKYEEANKKEEAAHDLEEKVWQSLIEVERRTHEAALAKIRNEEEYRSFQERRKAIDILEDVDIVELQQKLAAAGEQEKHL